MEKCQCGNTATVFINEPVRLRYCKTCNPSSRVSKCERRSCNRPGYKSIYGPGYLALVCREHYEGATVTEVRNAERFKYAE